MNDGDRAVVRAPGEGAEEGVVPAADDAVIVERVELVHGAGGASGGEEVLGRGDGQPSSGGRMFAAAEGGGWPEQRPAEHTGCSRVQARGTPRRLGRDAVAAEALEGEGVEARVAALVVGAVHRIRADQRWRAEHRSVEAVRVAEHRKIFFVASRKSHPKRRKVKKEGALVRVGHVRARVHDEAVVGARVLAEDGVQRAEGVVDRVPVIRKAAVAPRPRTRRRLEAYAVSKRPQLRHRRHVARR
mmetsp:Transcript_12777/g.38533  ORF Transcript_12777/g.38533 Transcript_12777/m.38533 type:complete len:244 (+) Transcript_12777:1915-2646(+)